MLSSLFCLNKKRHMTQTQQCLPWFCKSIIFANAPKWFTSSQFATKGHNLLHFMYWLCSWLFIFMFNLNECWFTTFMFKDIELCWLNVSFYLDTIIIQLSSWGGRLHNDLMIFFFFWFNKLKHLLENFLQ